MNFLPPKRRSIKLLLENVLFFSLLISIVFHQTYLAEAVEDDFRETLSEYGDSDYGDGIREKVRAKLSGREDEIWNYIKEAFRNDNGGSDLMAITAGLHALRDLDGFNEKILAEYSEILETESKRVQELNELTPRTPPISGISTNDEVKAYRRATKAIGLIRSSFFVFKTYGNGLSREMVLRFHQLNDGSVQTAVADWFKAKGDPNDIPALEARAATLKSIGDKNGSDLVLTVIDEIKLRESSTSPHAEEIEPEEVISRPISKSAGVEMSASSDSASEDKSISAAQPLWLYAVVALALTGIVVVLVRLRRRDTG